LTSISEKYINFYKTYFYLCDDVPRSSSMFWVFFPRGEVVVDHHYRCHVEYPSVAILGDSMMMKNGM